MTSSQQQRQALHREIYQIANDVRGSVDGWNFKLYVLCTLFYRFMSENFCDYVQMAIKVSITRELLITTFLSL
ncbi:type I restriction-modification system subunit M N-terminal domain-containing protein [Bartonella apis]|uniref:type I restriction-modification system subunit M N-terminal domain-containing protein n=1 Tax=Bartonella apis TaxID=1686310 RepID=UPI00096480C5|nr:type I restriction-modification system subunit M N-terminal domain-containing protein [Bartonella apis]MCT6825526.1 type I restriction-modification system subunit M N-terminal domain-containing protein [Bartonella apis]MCT6860472.1 type I restriction-modification system subunit M N-terminal domain-containing protein [Bartonella apis]OLY48702.1 HsdM N-terminal domain-containing protein [Bartonella apis]